MEDSDEDGVGQVEEGLGGGQPCVNIEDIAWESCGDAGFRWFGPQNHQGGRFLGLGHKTEVRARQDRAARKMRGAIMEVASRLSEVAT
jgi:hypothetical protein